MTNIKYLEDFTEHDIPKEKIKKEIKITQRTPNSNDYHRLFGEKSTIEDVWSEIYVYVYLQHKTDSKRLLIEPLELTFTPKKILNIPTSKASVAFDLLRYIEIKDKQYPTEEQYGGIKKYIQEQIVDGNMPWVSNKSDGIRTQNDLNRVITTLSHTIPELKNESVQAVPLLELFNQMYELED